MTRLDPAEELHAIDFRHDAVGDDGVERKRFGFEALPRPGAILDRHHIHLGGAENEGQSLAQIRVILNQEDTDAQSRELGRLHW